jgi:hypothetical protein
LLGFAVSGPHGREVMEKSCSPHGRQEARGARKGLGMRFTPPVTYFLLVFYHLPIMTYVMNPSGY